MNVRPIERLVMIDLGGMGEETLNALVERGLCPNLSSALAASAQGPFRSPYMTNPHVAAATAMTGRSPRHHMVYDTEYLDIASGMIHELIAFPNQGLHLWSVLAEAERKVFGFGQLLSTGNNHERVIDLGESADQGHVSSFAWPRRPKSSMELAQMWPSIRRGISTWLNRPKQRQIQGIGRS